MIKTISISALFVKVLLVLLSIQPVVGASLPQDQKSSHSITDKQQKLVNINTADLTELQTLPRVGPVTAQRIVEFRERHKGFKTLEDLMNVKGIGPKTYERLKSLITI